MTQEQSKMQPWQVFHAARKAMGANSVAQIFSRSIRSAHDWAQDPVSTQVRCKSPLELLHTLFERLDEIGRGYVVRAAIDYLLTAVSGADDNREEIKELLPTMDAEQLEDFRELSAFHRAINEGADPDLVETLMKEANDANERTYAKYLDGLK